MNNLVTVLTEEEIESIIAPITEKAQSIIDDGGTVTFKLYNDSLSLESESCTSIQCDCGELDISFEDGTSLHIPVVKYINGEDLDALNPILQFQDVFVELDMCDMEDC